MDRRSWPWKKKSSDKAAAEKAAAAAAASDSATAPADSTGSQAEQAKQENHKKPKYVQISMESYSHLTGLEDQVKSYEEQFQTLEEEVKELNEKLSAAHVEMTNKDNLVKQHAKVGEEAVSGWEKAEAEAAALKNHLESVTLLKLTAEDRASHLDGALKECMRQIRNLKEEHEQKLHELALNKAKQFDKMKHELEAKIAELDQEILRSAAENAALSRSLQERSNMIINLSEEKSQAEAEIELLKNNIKSCEKEINSIKYELHVVTKELEIRNEEKNMSVRSAEVANKQHLEGVKKIAKLEAECQRLRGLVRKKLPGPAALAQMKLEVESLGKDYGETRLRRSPVKPSSPHMPTLTEFSLDGIQKYQKENELLTERLLAMEEETKMLKEALAKRNSELQTSRSICAKTASKLQNLEAQFLSNGDHKSPPKPNAQLYDGTFSQNASNPPSLTSLSEDGNDDDVSCAGSWATGLMSDLSHFKKERSVGSPRKVETASHLELMDDFLEMEKLANYQSNDSNINRDTPFGITAREDSQSKEKHEPDPSGEKAPSTVEVSAQHDADLPPLRKLQSTISMIFESLSEETDKLKLLEDVRRMLQDMHDRLHPQSSSCTVEASQCSETKCENQTSPDAEIIAEKEISSSRVSKTCSESLYSITQEVVTAISQIHDFVILLGKEAKAVHGASTDGDRLSQKLEKFSASYDAVINSRMSLVDFVLDLSLVLTKASEVRLELGYKDSEAETGSSYCIDKVALPENKDMRGSSGENYRNGCTHFSDSASDPDIPHEGNPVPASESTSTSWKCSLEEFEQLKQEKDNMLLELAKCTENLETTKSQLQETEQQLAEAKSQLTSSQKMNSLSETQLKCMAESYKSLEMRAEELQKQVNLLQAKTETLENELQEEKRNHHDALAKCMDLEEQLQRIESGTAAETDARTNQERELAAAAEKLAECQETIFLLGKQLKTLRPQTELMGSPFTERSQKAEGLTGEEPTTSGMNLQDGDAAEIETASCLSMPRTGGESPRDLYNAPFSPSDSEPNNLLRSPISSKHPKHRPTKSGSSSSSSTPTPEKHSRGFSRFFSSKGKTGY